MIPSKDRHEREDDLEPRVGAVNLSKNQ